MEEFKRGDLVQAKEAGLFPNSDLDYTHSWTTGSSYSSTGVVDCTVRTLNLDIWEVVESRNGYDCVRIRSISTDVHLWIAVKQLQRIQC